MNFHEEFPTIENALAFVFNVPDLGMKNGDEVKVKL
jgi:hypothetical protein